MSKLSVDDLHDLRLIRDVLYSTLQMRLYRDVLGRGTDTPLIHPAWL